MGPTQEVHSVTKDDILRLIIQLQIRPMFLRPHLSGEQDWALVIGTIGERGAGKSGSDAVIALVDHMMRGKKCYSNMKIKCDIEVENSTAREYGLNSGGIVHYESEFIDKNALLKLGDDYRKCCILIEEINVQYSNVRRFMSNTNVDFNEVSQQLRKLEASLLFNVIDEMFIDPQLRALSDIFIKTYDTAFDVDNLENHKARGLDFSWRIYPMSGYLCGYQKRYVNTHKALDNVIFHFGKWRGIYDSMKHQEKGVYSMSTKDKNKAMEAEVTAESSPEIKEHFDEWAWLYEEISHRYQAGCKEMTAAELFDSLNLDPAKEDEANDYLVHSMKLKTRYSGGQKVYSFPRRVFERESLKVLA